MTSAAEPKETSSVAQAFKRFWGKFRKPLISIVIAYVVYGLTLMAWPTNPYFDPKPRFLRPIAWPFRFFGLYNEFKLYAPNPPMQNGSMLFRVSFDDGTSSFWVFPRDKLTPWDSDHSFDRYLHMYFFWNKNRLYRKARPDFARYIARQNDAPNRHPTLVEIIDRETLIPPPAQGIGQTDGQAVIRDFTYFSYEVKKGDLP
jgi:hypothetical protein